MNKKKVVPPAKCLEDYALAILAGKPKPHTLRALSEACGLSQEQQRAIIAERCGWHISKNIYDENILNSDVVAVRGPKPGAYMDPTLSSQIISILADPFIHQEYFSHPIFTSEKNPHMVRYKLVGLYTLKLHAAIASVEMSRRGTAPKHPLIHGRKACRNGRYGCSESASAISDRDAPEIRIVRHRSGINHPDFQ